MEMLKASRSCCVQLLPDPGEREILVLVFRECIPFGENMSCGIRGRSNLIITAYMRVGVPPKKLYRNQDHGPQISGVMSAHGRSSKICKGYYCNCTSAKGLTDLHLHITPIIAFFLKVAISERILVQIATCATRISRYLHNEKALSSLESD